MMMMTGDDDKEAKDEEGQGAENDEHEHVQEGEAAAKKVE